MVHILNKFSAIRKTIKELRDSIYENYFSRIGFPKENSYYLMKFTKEKDLILLAAKL